jgi:hypothetical protein
MAITELERWERLANREATKLFSEVRQRGEKHFTVRVRCPGCNGTGSVGSEAAENDPKLCPLCGGIGIAAFDWTRSEAPRSLRVSERRTEESERAAKVEAALARRSDKFA